MAFQVTVMQYYEFSYIINKVYFNMALPYLKLRLTLPRITARTDLNTDSIHHLSTQYS